MGLLKEVINSATFDAVVIFVPVIIAAVAIWHRFHWPQRHSLFSSPVAILGLTALAVVLACSLDLLHAVLNTQP